MKIILEKHAYAPELNRAFVGPTRTEIKVPGCQTIKEVRAQFFRRLPMAGRHVVLSTNYPGDKSWLNRRQSGMCNSVHQLGNALKALRNTLAPGYGATVEVRSRLIG